MSFLRKKVSKPMAIVITVVICIGTAAGALIWISNLVQRDVTVTDIPIILEEEYITPTYVDEYVTWGLNYTINEMDQCTGYIRIDVSSGSLFTTSEMNIVDVYVETDFMSYFYGASVSGYPNQLAGNVIIFAFENTYGGAFDFSDGGSTTSGTIEITMIFTVEQSFQLSLRLASSLA